MKSIAKSTFVLFCAVGILSGCNQSAEPPEPVEQVRHVDITKKIKVPVPQEEPEKLDYIEEEEITIKPIEEEIEEAAPALPEPPAVPTVPVKEISTESNVTNETALVNFKSDVYTLQYVLQTLGYVVIPSGTMNQGTEKAILEFQMDHQIEPSGIVDSKTSSTLNEAVKLQGIDVNTVSPTSDSTTSVNGDSSVKKDFTTATTPPTEGNWVVVNKSTNKLTLFKGGQAVQTYPVATGRTSALTPEGKFEILVRAVNPTWGGMGKQAPIKGGTPENPLGYRWLGINANGTKGGTYGIHGNNKPESIGTYASSGCVRMKNEDVESLYPMLPNGTPVWIGTAATLSSYGLN